MHAKLGSREPPTHNARPARSTMPPAVAFFDTETTGVDDDASITCAVVTDGAGDTLAYFSGYGEVMTPAKGAQLVDALAAAGRVVTWNGAAFDFKKLYALTGDDRCKALALGHDDAMLDFTATHGYFSSMDSVATGTLGPSKGKTNTGEWATTAWFNGSAPAVLEYCAQDTLVLKRIYDHAAKWGSLSRVTKAGKTRVWDVRASPADPVFRSVADSLAAHRADPPDCGWMTTPPPDLDELVAWAR